MAWSPNGRCLAAQTEGRLFVFDASAGYQLAAGPDYRYDQAFRLAVQDRDDASLAIFRELAAEFPDRADVRLDLARRLTTRRQHDEAIAVLHAQAAPLGRLITHTLPLADYDRAVDLAEHGRETAMKVAFTFDGAEADA